MLVPVFDTTDTADAFGVSPSVVQFAGTRGTITPVLNVTVAYVGLPIPTGATEVIVGTTPVCGRLSLGFRRFRVFVFT